MVSGFHFHAESLEIGRRDYFFTQRKEFTFFRSDVPLEYLAESSERTFELLLVGTPQKIGQFPELPMLAQQLLNK